ncbi:hypothetical protein [Desulfurococcus mucosus]|uniref:TRASH domain-containing protein n=1 Tax=Desulfurococcus mucosus (strain ATCC 35584 / DSM 2162 / JCM 9187 / O7/1) TaxID=765177 RepID=E8R748_DESM0|nr:hypothetical protein [Desulfurococcus mucosus]ADV65513.1 hypothetical protein Desmu_1217 [Desulfurococcus mucosus DSM 2162]
MSASRRHRCVVCGRVFPEGQGIVVVKDGLTLEFHSSRCASKFLRALAERMPADEFLPYARKLIDEFNELNEQREKARAKKI